MAETTQAVPFIYSVPATISANGTAVVALTLEQDSKFELHNFLATTSADAGSSNQHPNYFQVLIKDNATGRQLMNRPVDQAILTGPSNGSIREFRPIIFQPNTTIEFTFTNLTASSLNVSFALKGYKHFRL